MSAAKHSILNGGSALAADADPNATPPSGERLFSLPRPSVGNVGIWWAAEGGAPDFEIWAKLTTKWFSLSAGGTTTFAGVSGSYVAQAVNMVPPGAALFFRVTNAHGATALHFGTLTD